MITLKHKSHHGMHKTTVYGQWDKRHWRSFTFDRVDFSTLFSRHFSQIACTLEQVFFRLCTFSQTVVVFTQEVPLPWIYTINVLSMGKPQTVEWNWAGADKQLGSLQVNTLHRNLNLDVAKETLAPPFDLQFLILQLFKVFNFMVSQCFLSSLKFGTSAHPKIPRTVWT